MSFASQGLKEKGRAFQAHLTFWIAGIAPLVMGAALYVSATRTQEDVERLGRELAKAGRLAQAAAEANRAEATQRGFLLYGDEGFIGERNDAVRRLREEVGALVALMTDNAQRERLARLGELIEERANNMEATEARRRAERVPLGGGAPAQTQSSLIQQGLAEVRAHEVARIDAHRQAERSAYRRTILLIAVAMGALLVVLVPAYAMFLRESRHRRRAEGLVSSIANGVPGTLVRYRLFPDGRSRYEFVSGGVLKLRGFSREEAMRDPETVLGTIHEVDRPAFVAALEEAARTGSHVEHDYRVRGPGGELRWIRTTAAPERERDGSTVFRAYWSDVTEQKRLEADLREAKEGADAASRAKTAFLATMSHEIRTPMNGVLGMLELLALTELNQEQRGTLTVIRESGRSLMRIIDDILDLSKIEAGKLALSPGPADMGELAERVRNVYSGNASSKGLVLRVMGDARIGKALMVDPLRLLQILNNLVSNAIKFTDRGEVIIRVGLVERRPGVEVVRFSVSDTGKGISDEDRKRLFAPFSQVSSNPQGGTGLGLSICQRLATLMGSTIEVESRLGKGTTMSLTLALPVAPAQTPSVPGGGEENAHADPTLGRRRAPTVEAAVSEGSLVLVVDDHPINRMVLLRQVQALGYAAEAAEDGIDALEMWGTGRFAVIFTDCHMPELDGYALARHIRNCEERVGHARTPIIACTANVLGGEVERCLEAGMDDYLPKPVQLRLLARKLDQWVPLPDGARGKPTDTREASQTAIEHAGSRVLDRARLALVFGEGAEVQREALRKFREFNRQDVANLMRALEVGDAPQVTHYAHRIKGASRTFGAELLGMLAEEIERAARADDWKSVRARMPELHGSLDHFDRVVDAALDVGASPAAPREVT